MTTLELIVATVGVSAATAGIIWGAIKARSDWRQGTIAAEQHDRDEVKELLLIKDEMIDALKEANEELRVQVKQAVRREEQWRREREEYKQRLDAVEESFRSLLVAVVNAQICTRAPDCPDYIAPGNGRQG